MVIVESSVAEKRTPTITVNTKKAADERKYLLPTGAHLMVRNSAEVYPGDIVAKIPRATTKTKDITGGLPRVVEPLKRVIPVDRDKKENGVATSAAAPEVFTLPRTAPIVREPPPAAT